MNNVSLLGRLGGDVELKNSTTGTPIARFSLATNRTSKGEKVTDWHNCIAFGKTAEVAAEYLTKGRQVGVQGSVTYDKWEDKQGNKRTSTNIQVDRIHFVSDGKKEESDF